MAPQWRRWAEENLAEGADPAHVVDALEENGVPKPMAIGLVGELRRTTRAVAQLRQVLKLRRSLRPKAIRREPLPDAETFYRTYWETGTPAVFTGWVNTWPAFERWSGAYFAERFGDAEIEVCTQRAGDPRPDANFLDHRETMTMAAYVARVADSTAGNDVYAIANNRNTARPELRGLFDDVALPDGYFVEKEMPTSSAWWFGPAGTVTALHHDTSNIMFCQVQGRKRFLLAPPETPELLAEAQGVYSRRDPEENGAGFQELLVEAGEALFIPVGWWHHVRALDPAISLALNGFTRPNLFEWYKPGKR